jgi:hypothetical protein
LIDQMIVLYERCYDARLPQDLSSLGRTARSRPPAGVIVMRRSVVPLVGWFVIGLFVFGDAKAQILTGPLVVAQLQDTPAAKANSAASGLAAPAAPPTDERSPSGNPLWTIPLTSLAATRERPVFSSSRRPPPPVVAVKAPALPAPPPKPAEPEKPQLALVGTILEETGEGIGLFMIPAEHTAFRLKTGENHKGWILRKVEPRQVMLEKEKQIAILELPRHDMNKGGSAPPPAASANGKTGAVADEVPAASSSSVNNPNPIRGMSPPRPTGTPVVAPAVVVQPPANPEPQVNPFQKAWLAIKS